MQTRLTTPARFDALDRETFKQTIQSEAFRLVQSRIADELRRAEEVCVRADGAAEIHRAQGAVAALRAALQLPERIYQEMTHAK